VTYFIPDASKSGGMYVGFTGKVKKYDCLNRILYFTDNTEIKVDDISEIESGVFPKYEV
jgi:hypothetical protein